MPNTSSAKKKLRADIKKAAVNKRIKVKVKQAWKTLEAGPSPEALETVYSRLDKAAKKNVISKQKAARKKSQASKLLATSSSQKTSRAKKQKKQKEKK